MPANVKDYLPRWTKRVVTSMTGRDPLGLSRVSNLITDYLLKGIITTTDRARYYSFYCWAIWDTHQAKPKRLEDFRAGFRRREAAMALATVLHDSDTSPTGVEATRSALDRSDGRDGVDCDFQVLPSNPMGGYGQYYGGSLRSLGLVYVDDEGFDRVSELGQALAEAHGKAIAASPYVKEGLTGRAHISRPILEKSAKLMTLDGLDQSAAREERAQLIELFFTLQSTERNEAAQRRRETLGLLLHAVDFYQRKDEHLHQDEVDRRVIYFPHYHGKALLQEKLSPFPRPAQGDLCSLYWRQFCLHQYVIQSLEGLLYSLLETIGSRQEGLPLQEAIDLVVDAGLVDNLNEIVGAKCSTPAKLLAAAEGSRKVKTQEEGKEYEIATNAVGSPTETAANALALAAILYGRWRNGDDDAYKALHVHAGRDLWAGTLLPALDSWRSDDLTWKEAIASLYQTFVIDRHDQVMYEKHRLDSCWLHRQEGRVIKDQDYEPFFRSSRHRNAVRIMTDLGLLQLDQDRLEISSAGKRVLKEVWG